MVDGFNGMQSGVSTINIITLTYGPVPGRPPTIFFNYPPFLQMQRPFVPNRILKLSQEI